MLRSRTRRCWVGFALHRVNSAVSQFEQEGTLVVEPMVGRGGAVCCGTETMASTIALTVVASFL